MSLKFVQLIWPELWRILIAIALGVLIVFMLVLMTQKIDESTPPVQTHHDTTPSVSEPSPYASNPLDGRPDTPHSEHCGVVTPRSSTDFWVKGKLISIYFVLGSPDNFPAGTGTLCVVVPGFEDRDDGNEFYFHSFTPKARHTNEFQGKPPEWSSTGAASKKLSQEEQ